MPKALTKTTLKGQAVIFKPKSSEYSDTPVGRPAHVGLAAKEQADRPAKAGSRLMQTNNPVSHQEIKSLLHSKFN